VSALEERRRRTTTRDKIEIPRESATNFFWKNENASGAPKESSLPRSKARTGNQSRRLSRRAAVLFLSSRRFAGGGGGGGVRGLPSLRKRARSGGLQSFVFQGVKKRRKNARASSMRAKLQI